MIDQVIQEKRNCTGCHACANICPQACISMRGDDEGFLYPKVDYDRCIRCGKCIDVCPIFHEPERNDDPIAFACINIDDDKRMRSSSGGIFTLLAEEVLACGGVVFGAAFDDSFVVRHRLVESIEDIPVLQGSKYVQSIIGDSFCQVKVYLDKDRMVLFSGTPCQIAGLKCFLEKDYEKLIAVDIVCHGVPSPSVWRKYIEFREHKAGSCVTGIRFRDKSKGWKDYSVAFLFENGKEYRRIFRKDIYMIVFLKNAVLRPSCYHCQFKGINRCSDITLADFWGVVHVCENFDDDKGTSLVLSHSNTGKKMLERLSSRIISRQVDVHEALSYNQSALMSSIRNSLRERYLKELNSENFTQLSNKYFSDSFGIRVKKFVSGLLHKTKLKRKKKPIRSNRSK